MGIYVCIYVIRSFQIKPINDFTLVTKSLLTTKISFAFVGKNGRCFYWCVTTSITSVLGLKLLYIYMYYVCGGCAAKMMNGTRSRT